MLTLKVVAVDGWLRAEISGYWLRFESVLMYVARSSARLGWLGFVRSSEMASNELTGSAYAQST
jgi:hypothetical protein